MNNATLEKEGLRERKRRETYRRIAETGMKLFITHGYEATTLDAIAEAAGISRRTFFHYFKSKDDVLLAFQSSMSDVLRAALLQEPLSQAPIDAARNAFLKTAAPRQKSHQEAVVERLVDSNDALLARKQAGYVLQERALFATLCEMWPQPERRVALRLVAMASIGAMRLAVETGFAEGGKRPMVELLEENFAALRAEI